VVVGCAALAVAGCSATYYTEDADREVYEIVAEKQDRAFGRALPFSVEPDKAIQDFFGEAGERAGPGPEAEPEGEPTEALPEPGPEAITITTADALRLAVLANRDYQTRKETVYLAALTLTFQRYLFRPHPFATGTVDLENDEGDRERSFAGTSDVGFSQRLADGALVTASLGLTALKYINQELGDTLSSTLAFSLQQPLWRGAGRRIVQENLIQVERNALYAVRTFARFEKTFAVSVATQYLRVLERRQVVLNEWRNYQSLKEGRERAEWLAEADRLPEFQVDQAKQDELRAYNRWIVAREGYLNALDSFKIVLGIPVESPVVLDPKDLERLAEAGLGQVDMGVGEAVAKALQERLDMANTRDGYEDSGRKVVVAEDGLKGDVDLVASIGYASDANRGAQSARLAFHQGDYSIGLEIDLPIDRLSERNALRETQIDREQAGRALSLLEDQIVLQVREAYRGLEQARQSYDIQRRSVELAERRVESTQLLLQAGRASQRDVLESQRALVEARNALARALVDHTIAGLEFQRDAGTLVVDQEGQIHGWSLSENP